MNKLKNIIEDRIDRYNTLALIEAHILDCTPECADDFGKHQQTYIKLVSLRDCL